MVTTRKTRPRFQRGQTAYFIGGKGVIQTYQQESGDWTYIIEMALGPEPEMGRIGSETRVRLFETDLSSEACAI